MKKNNDLNEVLTSGKKILKLLYILMIILAVAIVLFAGKYFGVFATLFKFLSALTPIVIGLLIAWLLNPFVKKMKEKKIPTILGATIVYILIFLFTYLFFVLLIPLITEQINDLIKIIPQIFANTNSLINNIFSVFENAGLNVASTKEALLLNIEEYLVNMGQNLPNLALAAIVGFVGFIKEIFLGLLIGFYMLIDYDNFSKQLAKVIPFKHKEGIKKLSDNIDVEVRKTVTGTLLLAFIVFLLNAIGFVAIGLKGSIILAIVCGIVDLIPFIGPYIGIGIVTIIGFTMSPFIGFAALAISSAVQVLENIILRPVIMSKATDLNPVIILSGLLIFAHFWGIIGMIISTPLLAIIKVLYQHFELKIPILNKTNV